MQDRLRGLTAFRRELAGRDETKLAYHEQQHGNAALNDILRAGGARG